MDPKPHGRPTSFDYSDYTVFYPEKKGLSRKKGVLFCTFLWYTVMVPAGHPAGAKCQKTSEAKQWNG